MGWFSKLIKTEAVDWHYGRLDDSGVPDDVKSPAIPQGQECYLSLVIESMRVTHVRIGFDRFHAVVHAAMEVPHRGYADGIMRMRSVIAPDTFKDVVKTGFDKMIAVSKVVGSPVAYRGGKVTVEVGLLSVRSTDLSAPYVGLLESISKGVPGSPISGVLAAMDPLKEGVRLLLGSANAAKLEVGLDMDMAAPQPGCWALIAVPKDQVEATQLVVDKTDRRLSVKGGRGLTDASYVVFSIRASDRNPGWREIPSVKGDYEAIERRVLDQDYPGAKEALASFKSRVLFSPDLIRSDALNIYKYVEQQVAEALGSTQTSGRAAKPMPGLKAVEIYA
jgi:hypothetical protein